MDPEIGAFWTGGNFYPEAGDGDPGYVFSNAIIMRAIVLGGAPSLT